MKSSLLQSLITDQISLRCPAGTGLREAVSLLESMLGDGTDFVRQGASIALALVLVQQPEAVVEPFRKRVSARLLLHPQHVVCASLPRCQ
jgi:26S proteasome regulatory subunit N2